MILRRFMKHVTDQNWFAVGLDVIVVIVGIFLGLQVQDWNEEREERIEEQSYIERLSVELQETMKTNQIVIKELSDNQLLLTNAIKSLLAGDVTEQSMPKFEENFYSSIFFPHPIIQNSVINEMLSTGKVAIISNIEIKNALVRYNSAIAGEQVNINGQFSEFLATRRTLHENITLAPDYFKTKKILDAPEDLLNNKILIAKLGFINEFENKQIEQLNEFQEATINFKKLLIDYLKGRNE